MRHFLLTLILFAWLPFPAMASGTPLELDDDCPPGFQLSGGACELRSLYLMYASLQDQGVGGLKTPLASMAFPQQAEEGPKLPVGSSIPRRGLGARRALPSVLGASTDVPQKL